MLLLCFRALERTAAPERTFTCVVTMPNVAPALRGRRSLAVDRNQREGPRPPSSSSQICSPAAGNQQNQQNHQNQPPELVSDVTNANSPGSAVLPAADPPSITGFRTRTGPRQSPKTGSRLQNGSRPGAGGAAEKQNKEERKNQAAVQLRRLLLQGNRRVEALATVIQHLFSARTSVEDREERTSVEDREERTSVEDREERTSVEDREERTCVEDREERTCVRPRGADVLWRTSRADVCGGPSGLLWRTERTSVDDREEQTSCGGPRRSGTVCGGPRGADVWGGPRGADVCGRD
ncbi:hypothetical protein FQA47_018301 [Oryzias melastigma]|uniref:Uncharacterized protein n=1 Tax=Oryzias melastigma TaxID=30732 RepID=A0A834L2G0_ORYME|nr:hypothetical protein FQA47_018301 [Oryzias melastigma]